MNILDWEDSFQHYLQHQIGNEDKAHDLSHFIRVWHTARRIMQASGADELIVLTACYFHDVVNLAKNHPERYRSSLLAANKTIQILQENFPTFPLQSIAKVAHAIEAHSYSASVTPLTLEAKIVQDADRLESLGAIGLARVFHISGQLGRSLFHPDDPLALDRSLDDSQYAFDHFQTKLLTLPDTMQTERGREMARYSCNYMIDFMAKLSAELRGDHEQFDYAALGNIGIGKR